MSNGVPPPPPPSAPPPATYPPPGVPAPAKKGLSPLAWVGIGCGGLLLLALVAFAIGTTLLVNKGKELAAEYEGNPARAAAELVVRVNPDLEMVSTDEEAGTMTIRQISTGKVGTFSYSDLQKGKFSWSSDDGSVSYDLSNAEEEGIAIETAEGRTVLGGKGSQLPEWVPLPDGVTQSGSLYSSQSGDTVTGAFTYGTDRDPDELVDFYVQALEGAGFEVETNRLEAGGSRHASVSGRRDGQSVTATVTTEAGTTNLMLHYEGRTP